MRWASVRLAFQTLRANPLRTTLSTLGIIMGAASLAAVLSIGDGAEAFARQRLEREGMQMVVLTSKTADLIDGLRVPRREVPSLGPAEAHAIAAELGSGYSVTLWRRGTARWQLPAGGDLRASAIAGRLSVGAPIALPLEAGRDLSGEEMRSATPVALASWSLANAVAAGSAARAVGREIVVSNQRVRIVGVLAPTPGRGSFELTVPEAVASALMVPSRDPQPPFIAVRAPGVEEVPALRQRLDAWTARRYADGVTVASRGLDTLRDLAQGILIFKLIMGTFTAISLIVGGIGIMNVLLASVLERTREIGIRKAVGARHRDVVVQFLTESVSIALAGSLTGLLLGIGAAFASTAVMRAKTQALIYAALSWETVVVSLVAAIVTGLVFGVYPAIRAARLSPVDAMRYE